MVADQENEWMIRIETAGHALGPSFEQRRGRRVRTGFVDLNAGPLNGGGKQ